MTERDTILTILYESFNNGCGIDGCGACWNKAEETYEKLLDKFYFIEMDD